ncbi:hypothetical protein EJB05_27437, partial [Eragrostis curvula]
MAKKKKQPARGASASQKAAAPSPGRGINAAPPGARLVAEAAGLPNFWWRLHGIWEFVCSLFARRAAAGGLGVPTLQGDATRGAQHHPAEAPPAAPVAQHHAEAPPAAPDPASTSSLPPGFGVSAEVGELRAAGGTPSAKDETPSGKKVAGQDDVQGGGEGAHHHTETVVFEEAPPAALTPDASVRHAATSSLPQGTAPARVSSSSATSLGADEAGLVDGSSSQDCDPAARPQDGADASVGTSHHAATSSSSFPQVTPAARALGDLAAGGANQAGRGGKGGGRRAKPGRAKKAKKVNGTSEWIDDEEYAEEVIDPEIEAHCKYVKKVSAWRKGYTICLICHLEGKQKEIKGDNDEIIKHCLGIHKGEGYKCEKRGCLARGKTKHDTGLHEIECRG